MNIAIIGGASFLGKNLAQMLCHQSQNKITVIDEEISFWKNIPIPEQKNIRFSIEKFGANSEYEKFLPGQDIVYHLASTSFPAISNINIKKEMEENIIGTIRLLDSCIACKVGRIVFFSSGGAIYGENNHCPLSEDVSTNPITAYGVQKLTIEKLLYLYKRIYGLEFKIIRMANPFGPYQRPNGKLGAVTTFIYRALHRQEINVYGNGSVIRDYIYVEDAIRAVINIANDEKDTHDIYNVGSGYGTSIKNLLSIIQDTLQINLKVLYQKERTIDVPVNYLDCTRYEKKYGPIIRTGLVEGIKRTAQYLQCNDIFETKNESVYT